MILYNRYGRSVISLSITIALLTAAASAARPAPLQGSWAGILTDGASSLYLVLTLTTAPTGSIASTISYPREGEGAFPAESTSVQGDGFRVTAKKNGQSLRLAGAFADDRITGTFQLGSREGALELWPLRTRLRADLLAYVGDFSAGTKQDVLISESLGVLYFLDLESGRTGRLYPLSDNRFFGGPTRLIYLPVTVRASFTDYADGSFQTLKLEIDGTTRTLHRMSFGSLADVSFAASDARIAGTLRRPAGPGPFPAILLLAGSNAQPRSGYYSIEDFVADEFLRLGFIVLNFDKRGVGSSTGKAGDNGVELVAAAAFRFLASRPGVDRNRIGIWGMSQGGIIAPKVAMLEPGVRFIINVSGSVVDANTEEIERTARMLRADGFREPDVADAVAFQRLKFQYAQTGRGWDEYTASYRRFKDRPWFPDPYVGPPASRSSTAWKFWRESGAIRPFEYWRAFREPVLLMYGQYDSIGDPAENAALFVAAMKSAGNDRYTVSILPDTDHSMYVSRSESWKAERLLTNLNLAAFRLFDAWLSAQGIVGQP
jgi:alpha-beta hydrolase superfamily lysophospholipase